MIKSKWYVHPVFVFVVSIAAIGTSLQIYISSSIEVSASFAEFMRKNHVNPDKFLASSSSLNIVILSILCVLVVASIAIIFTYYRKVISLYRMQQNFINGFTHELKTPVTSLKLYLDTFSMYELDRETQLKYIDFMKRDANRLSDNVSMILNLARIEDKKYVVDYTHIYFEEFITELLGNNEHLFKNAVIDFKGEPHLYFYVDKALLETLFMNLLVNALTYNMNDKPEISINALLDGSNVKIAIQDNGIGLDKDDKKRIFKKFYRVKKVVKGSGIGLYLSQQIAKLHNGSLKADSLGPGLGSTFTIIIPQVNDEK